MMDHSLLRRVFHLLSLLTLPSFLFFPNFLSFILLPCVPVTIMGICCAKPAKLAHASSTNISGRDNPNCKSNVESTDSSLKTVVTPISTTSFVKPKFDVSCASALKSFNFIDLKNATKNFRSESLLGEGGFGCVFKGWIDEHSFLPTKPGTGIVVAVKKLKRESLQGYKEWLAEVNYLGQLRHENLVRLIGYCSESDNRLLVYEFMPKGSLENHLFRS